MHSNRTILNAGVTNLIRLVRCSSAGVRHYNLLGCPKPADISHPLMGRSSAYCENIWTRYCRLTGFYSAQQCSHCKRCTSYSNSVCLSVSLSVRPTVTRSGIRSGLCAPDHMSLEDLDTDADDKLFNHRPILYSKHHVLHAILPALSIFTARLIASSVLTTAIPSVCLSVRPSVTRRYFVKTTARSTVHFALSDSKLSVVLCKPKNIPQVRPLPLKSWLQVTYPPPDNSES